MTLPAELRLDLLAPSLRQGAEGIWVAPGSAEVSYPEGGHAACLQLEDSSFWFRHRNACILASVARWAPAPSGPFFDVGAGNGYVARGLADAGLQVVAVEPGVHGALNARRRGLRHVVCATTGACGFPAGAAGAVGAFDVIEHIDDESAFLAEMRRLLAPGGRLYATVPAYPLLWSSEDTAAGHYRRYTRASLCAALARAGFEIDYASYFFRWLVAPVGLLRALPYRLGLRREGGRADVNAREHDAGSAAGLIDALLRSERERIAAGRSMAYGASLLVVAR